MKFKLVAVGSFFVRKNKKEMEIHHHHHHYHHEMEGGSLKSVGNAFKKAFSKQNLIHAGEAAIPAVTTTLGGMAAGPVGAAAGAASGYLIDHAIQGDGFRKGTKKHVNYYLKKRYDAKHADPYDERKHHHYRKKFQEAREHLMTNPYHYKSTDKEHQKALRAARKLKKTSNDIFGDDPQDVAGEGFAHHSSRRYANEDYRNKVDTHMSKMHKASSPWIAHVKAYASAHGIKYGQALREAKASYHSS